MTTAPENENPDQGTPTPETGGTPTPPEPTPEPPANDPPASTAAAPEGETAPESEDPPSNPMPEWMKARLAKMTAARHEAERRAAEAEAKLAALGKAPEGDPKPSAEVDVDKLAEAKAAELVAAREFNNACNAIAAKGKAEFKDFDASLKNFDILGGLQPSTVQLAMEADNPHEVLYALSKDLEKAAEILSLPPLKQVKEILKFEAGLAKKGKPTAQVSSAPAPIEPKLGGGSRASTEVNLYDDNTDTKAWIEARNKQVQAQRTVH